MFICVGNNESFEFAKSVGMGLVDSAIGLTRLILHYAPREIIFVGSAGSYEYFEGVDSKLESSLDSANSAFLDSNLSAKNLDSKDSAFLDSKNLDSKNAAFNKDSKDSTLNIGDIFYSTHATQLELSFLESKSYTPIDNSVVMESFDFTPEDSIKDSIQHSKNVTHETNFATQNSKILNHVSHETQHFITPKILAQLPHAIVNSSNYITNTHKFNNAFLRAGIRAENMEFFAILNVARYFNIPAIGLFCISNFVCENAHTQFLQNHAATKQNLSNFIRKNFDIESRF